MVDSYIISIFFKPMRDIHSFHANVSATDSPSGLSVPRLFPESTFYFIVLALTRHWWQPLIALGTTFYSTATAVSTIGEIEHPAGRRGGETSLTYWCRVPLSRSPAKARKDLFEKLLESLAYFSLWPYSLLRLSVSRTFCEKNLGNCHLLQFVSLPYFCRL